MTTLRIDPHVHSEASHDGTEPVELLLEQAADIGLDAVVVTDHDVIHESLRAAELAPEYGLVGIPGVEVSTAHGHLLAIGVEEMPPHREPIGRTAEWIRDRGGVAIVPHPFQRSRHGVRKRHLAGVDVDAVEVYNSWFLTGYNNRRANRFAEERGFPGVASSDAHKVEYVGRAYTEIDLRGTARESVTGEEILAAIRDGSTRIEGRRTPIGVSSRHYVMAGTKKSAYYAKVGAKRGGHVAWLGAKIGSHAAVKGLRSGTSAARTGVRLSARLLSGL